MVISKPFRMTLVLGLTLCIVSAGMGASWHFCARAYCAPPAMLGIQNATRPEETSQPKGCCHGIKGAPCHVLQSCTSELMVFSLSGVVRVEDSVPTTTLPSVRINLVQLFSSLGEHIRKASSFNTGPPVPIFLLNLPLLC